MRPRSSPRDVAHAALLPTVSQQLRERRPRSPAWIHRIPARICRAPEWTRYTPTRILDDGHGFEHPATTVLERAACRGP
uniref:Uncharacterized protein n=1 Tax=Arundo donax TaxID=35708 RepID=A0A0A9C4G8_ARUDO